MKHKPSRYSILINVLLFYFFPILLLSLYSLSFAPLGQSWELFAAGLFFMCCGSILLFVRMLRLEGVQEPVPLSNQIQNTEQQEESALYSEQIRDLGSSLSKAEEDYTALQNELIHLKAELTRTLEEKQELQHTMESFGEELKLAKNNAEERLLFKEQLLQEAQQSAREQRSLIEKHQQHITNLESKEKDLHYELQTLLQLTSLPNTPADFSSDIDDNFFFDSAQINKQSRPQKNVSHSSLEGGVLQLKRCLDAAAKIHGPYYSNMDTASVSSLNLDQYDNYALDLRRLFDRFCDEHNHMIIVYSQKDNKMLFVNDPVKTMLGWSPEKFIQEFFTIVQPDQDVWQQGLNQLAMKKEVKLQLSMKSKSGPPVSFECHLGAIHSGPFRYHAIGVLNNL